jgi:hypothetical protein
MCGQVLQALGRIDEARSWLASGIEVVHVKGDAHAMSELESALQALS